LHFIEFLLFYWPHFGPKYTLKKAFFFCGFAIKHGVHDRAKAFLTVCGGTPAQLNTG